MQQKEGESTPGQSGPRKSEPRRCPIEPDKSGGGEVLNDLGGRDLARAGSARVKPAWRIMRTKMASAQVPRDAHRNAAPAIQLWSNPPAPTPASAQPAARLASLLNSPTINKPTPVPCGPRASDQYRLRNCLDQRTRSCPQLYEGNTRPRRSSIAARSSSFPSTSTIRRCPDWPHFDSRPGGAIITTRP